MPEHRIRFRAGWEVHSELDLDAADRFLLPTHWPAGLEGTVRLIRRFGRPRSQATEEKYRLELLRVPGLVSLSLNGRELEHSGPDGGNIVVPLVDPLLDRNTLVIDVDLGQITRSSLPEGWGAISLVIDSETIGQP
jgi:hypothetical protein